MSKCSKCAKMSDCYTPKMKGEGSRDSDIMLIGEAPGEFEDKKGIPFVGPAGKYLNRLLVHAGIVRSECYITNVVKCRPPNNKKPTDKEIKNCLPYLDAEIRGIQPRVLFVLGSCAFNAVVDVGTQFWKDGKVRKKRASIIQWKNNVLRSYRYNCWVIPVYHPAALMRMKSNFERNRTIEAFIAGEELSVKKIPPQLPHKEVLIREPKHAVTLFENALTKPELAMDLETRTLAWKTPTLGVSIAGSPTKGYYVDWNTIANNTKVTKVFRELIQSKSVAKIFHNVGFDLRIL